jgi:hypothetical protein
MVCEEKPQAQEGPPVTPSEERQKAPAESEES